MQSVVSRSAVLVAFAVTTAGCGDFVAEVRRRVGGEDSENAATNLPATLSLDLVPGIEVFLDEVKIGRTPLASVELSSGHHVLTLEHRCGEVPDFPLDVVGGKSTTLSNADFPGLKTATLRLTISATHGQTLAPKVWTGEADRGDSQGDIEHVFAGDDLRMLACRQRVRVESGHVEVGGYYEDISFAPGQTITRVLALAPGPDMVRLTGGDFLAGMRPEDEALTEEDDEIYPRHAAKIAPFDLDRSAVTAGQWSACRAAGHCKEVEFESSQGPSDPSVCAADPSDHRTTERHGAPPGEVRGGAVRKGATHHPMNCVARYEAERYCAWAGKRLPTIDEHEYAARSGRSDWKCPWGSGTRLPLCSRRAQMAGESDGMVCSYSPDNSIQGICDLVWLQALVADTRLPGEGRCDDFTRPGSPIESEGPIVGGATVPWVPASCDPYFLQFAGVTFRCARDVIAP